MSVVDPLRRSVAVDGEQRVAEAESELARSDRRVRGAALVVGDDDVRRILPQDSFDLVGDGKPFWENMLGGGLEEADLGPLLGKACERIRETYADVTLEIHAEGSFPVWVDVGRISGAMVELMDNAGRYSPPGGRIVVNLQRVTEGVMFTVTDFGEGLHRDLVRAVFREPFVTGEEILRKERAGLGLGLYLARQLVVLHGGIMWADPLPAGGSRVAFCIPQHPPCMEVKITGEGPAPLETDPPPAVPLQPSGGR